IYEGRVDLALLVEDPAVKYPAFEFLLQERILAALPPEHPLSGKASLSLSELKEDGFILCREGYHLRSITLKACETAGFTPRISVSGTDVDTALRFVKAGLGVTLIPEFVAGTAQGVAFAHLEEPRLYRSVGIAWDPQRYLSKAASALLDLLRTSPLDGED